MSAFDPSIGFAASHDGGPPEVWSCRRTRREAIDRIHEGAMGVDDYRRLDRAGRWKLAKKNGWRVVKVKLVEVSP